MERAGLGLTAQGQPADPAVSAQAGVGEKTRFCATRPQGRVGGHLQIFYTAEKH